ncbi:hypothetical protein D1007_12297 [Hordeum vulgare]|nr:hypothetical protein D1007_12297 [Hordeum vulgare]
MEELTYDDKVEEMLDDLGVKDEDIIDRLDAMKKHRDDPLHHIEGDSDVDEPYEADDDEEEATEEENAREEEGSSISSGGSKRKGPTTRSHAILDEIVEKDWLPSSDKERNHGDLCEEVNDWAQKPCVKLPHDRKRRAKKKKPRV